jgi:DNA-binding LacI/PurR family transcriptional regulator
MKKTNLSIKDIAKAAGVSHSTVSRALADSRLIPESTRQRIQRIARERGYKPNAMARGLVTRRSRAIGVIVTTIADPFVAQVVRGIETVAGERGYRVFLGTSHNDPQREMNLVEAMHQWRVDGVIVSASRVGALYQPLLREIGAPIVLINNQNQADDAAIHSIGVDDAHGAQLATQHLSALGHRVIGYLGGPPDHRAHRDRLRGYQRALAEAGIAFDSALAQSGNGSVEGGEPIAQWLTREPRPTAIFCYNDMTAIGALSALKRQRVRVPQDVSLVGFDDILFAAYTEPPLTTIHQPKDEMGRLAMKMVLDLLEGKAVDNVVMPGRLILRESTAPPRS